jgi:hypothetical protein
VPDLRDAAVAQRLRAGHLRSSNATTGSARSGRPFDLSAAARAAAALVGGGAGIGETRALGSAHPRG